MSDDGDIDVLMEKLRQAIELNKEKKRSGVGKLVNSLRHHPGVGVRAKQLVTKWKSLAFGGDDDATDEPSCSGGVSVKKEPTVPVKDDGQGHRERSDVGAQKGSRQHKVKLEPRSDSGEPQVKKRKKITVPLTDEFTGNVGLSFNDILGLGDVKGAGVRKGNSSSPKPVGGKPLKSVSPAPPTTKVHSSKPTRRSTASEKVYAAERQQQQSVIKEEKVDLIKQEKEVKEEAEEDSEEERPTLAPFVPPPTVFDSAEQYNRDYKPLVRALSPAVDRRPKMPTGQDGREDIGELIKTKNSKTQVYSGAKSAAAMRKEVPSLFQISKQVLKDNVEFIEFTGGIPFDILKDILIVATPVQLARIEEFNDYLILETDELWQGHTKKAFPRAARLENEAWRETYFRCVEEREERLKNISASISAKKAQMLPVRQTKLAFAAPPREVRRRQEKYGTLGGEKRMPASGRDLAGHRRDTFDKKIDGDSVSIKRDSYHAKPTVEPTPSSTRKPKIAPMMLKAKKMLGMRR